jgi:branched-subunit amino acid aminotransferase/4-amino-4-deoxychorismate lyase
VLFPYCFFKDRIIPVSEANISVQDLGVLRGYAIFDYLCAHNGKPFLLEEHLNRFFNSAARMYLQPPQTRDQIKKIIASLLSQNEVTSNRSRLRHPKYMKKALL